MGAFRSWWRADVAGELIQPWEVHGRYWGVGARDGVVGAPGASDRSYSPVDKSTGAFRWCWRAEVARKHIHPWSESMGVCRSWYRMDVARKLIHLWTSPWGSFEGGVGWV
jgi:hypothetical protein